MRWVLARPVPVVVLSLWLLAGVSSGVWVQPSAVGGARAGDPATEPASPPDPDLLDRIGKGLLEACPAGNGCDAGERDAAAHRLSRQFEFIDAAEDEVLWGPAAPSDRPSASVDTGLRLAPPVAVRIYLSMFMLEGPVKLGADGGIRTLEMSAKFRSGLPAGDYPEPFWRTPELWRSYTATSALVFFFRGDTWVGVVRRTDAAAGAVPPPKGWDGQWRWNGPRGVAEPRAAMFAYLCSPENSYLRDLEKAYQGLDGPFRAEGCYECHSGKAADGPGRAIVLSYPNQSLAGCDRLLAVLRGEGAPGTVNCRWHGDRNAESVKAMVKLADEFQSAANGALSFESARRAVP